MSFFHPLSRSRAPAALLLNSEPRTLKPQPAFFPFHPASHPLLPRFLPTSHPLFARFFPAFPIPQTNNSSFSHQLRRRRKTFSPPTPSAPPRCGFRAAAYPFPAHPRTIKSIRRSGGASGHPRITPGTLWSGSGGALGAIRGRFFIADLPRLIHNAASNPNFSSSPQTPGGKSFFFPPSQSISPFVTETCRPSWQLQIKPTKSNQTHQKPPWRS